jgi:TRAP-type mannitol/chloroaromatic compound transport system substrate-binding protein
MEAFLKTSNEVNAEASATNPDFKKIYENLMAFKNEEYLWWQIADFSYDSFMIRSRTRS